MRTPRWLRVFIGWRWAPCILLLAGSLAFIALALLLIPLKGVVSAPIVSVSPALDHLNAASVHRPFNAAAPPTVFVPSQPSLDSATVPPLVILVGTRAANAAQPDFAANIRDRGDRPHAPVQHGEPSH